MRKRVARSPTSRSDVRDPKLVGPRRRNADEAGGSHQPRDALDLMQTAQCAINGLAREIIDGKLGDIDDARAAKLAVGVTHVLGCGFAPRPTKPRR